MLGMTTGDEGN